MEKHRTKRTRLSSGAIALTLLAIGLMALLLWAVTSPSSVTTEPSTCCQKPVVLVGNTAQDIVEAHTFELTAWCDHQPLWEEASNRRHLAVEGGKQTEIQAVEVRVGQSEHKRLLGAYVRLGTHTNVDLSKIQVEGMFSEGMHGADLEVTIRYTVAGVRFETIRHCVVGVTH